MNTSPRPYLDGHLQADADRERVMDGRALTEEEVPSGLDTILQRLAPRWFMLSDRTSRRCRRCCIRVRR